MLAFFRHTAVALPRLISLRRTHAEGTRSLTNGHMVNDGKSSSVWSVEEDAELARLQQNIFSCEFNLAAETIQRKTTHGVAGCRFCRA